MLQKNPTHRSLRGEHPPARQAKLQISPRLLGENAGRKRAETELASSLSVLHATLESTIDGILVVDHNGKLTTFNRTFAEMWRIPREVLDARDDERELGAAIGQLKEPAAFMQKVRELYTQPEADSFDVLELKVERIIERYSQPQRIGPAIVGRVWCFRDITGRTTASASPPKTSREFSATASPPAKRATASGCTPAPSPPGKSAAPSMCTATAPASAPPLPWNCPANWISPAHENSTR